MWPPNCFNETRLPGSPNRPPLLRRCTGGSPRIFTVSLKSGPTTRTCFSLLKRPVSPPSSSTARAASSIRLRQEVRAMLPASVDAFGHGFRAVEEKSEALNTYAYSIAIENSVQDAYFTEKLVDCFTTGTVPIYWGTRTFARHFDSDGLIRFTDMGQLPDILRSLSLEDYQRRGTAILRNYETAFRYHVPEEWGVRNSR